MHNSCEVAVQEFNKRWRRAIWFAEHGQEPARGSEWDHGVSRKPVLDRKKKNDFDLAKLRACQKPEWKVDRAWLRARSSVDPTRVTSEQFLDALYPEGEKVLVFTVFASQGQFIWWRGKGGYHLGDRREVKAVASSLPKTAREGVWFLNQPIDGQWYLKQGSADYSRRSEPSVTSWRYMVLESDDAPEDLWLNYLAQLPLRIVAIYTSGGKSAHALVRVDAASKPEWDRIKAVVAPLLTQAGADFKTLTAVRLTRLPGCLRQGKSNKDGSYQKFDTPRLQELLYFRPDADDMTPPIGEIVNAR